MFAPFSHSHGQKSHEQGTNFFLCYLLKMFKRIFYATLEFEVRGIVPNSFGHRRLFLDQLGFSFLTLIPYHSSSLFTISTVTLDSVASNRARKTKKSTAKERVSLSSAAAAQNVCDSRPSASASPETACVSLPERW